MRDNRLACVAASKSEEGGYVNHPRDPGGATNYGVIQRNYDKLRDKHGLPRQSVKLISDAEVAEVYDDFWDAVNGDALDYGIDLATYDAGINSGPSRGVKWLQRALGTRYEGKEDGKPGPMTIAAQESLQPPEIGPVISRLCGYRLSFMQSLKIWATFGRGWAKRVARIEAKALAMVAQAYDMAGAPNRQAEADARAKEEAAGKTAATGAGGAATTGGGAAVTTDPSLSWVMAGLAVLLALAAVYAVWRWRVQRLRRRENGLSAAAIEADDGSVKT